MEETVNGQRESNGQFRPGNTVGFKPGQSGNPKGGPRKEFSLTMLTRAIFEADPKKAAKAARRWADQVESGDRDARRDLQDRLEGKVANAPQELKHSGSIGKAEDLSDDELVAIIQRRRGRGATEEAPES